MSKFLVIDPAFAVPLTPEQLHDLGVIAVIWGQIDFMLDEILAHVHAFDKAQRDAFLTDKMIGTKVEMLTKEHERLPPELHGLAVDLVKRINRLKQRRNSAFHGVWGWRLEKRSKTRQVAAYHHKTRDNPLRAQNLRAMTQEMIDCSKVAGQLMSSLLGFDFRPATQFAWGPGGDEPPPWMTADPSKIQKGRHPTDRRQPASDTQPKAEPR
jgi:hypothetical protein